MTTYYQSTTQNFLKLAGNGGILISSVNVQAKTQADIQATVNKSLNKVKEALKGYSKVHNYKL